MIRRHYEVEPRALPRWWLAVAVLGWVLTIILLTKGG